MCILSVKSRNPKSAPRRSCELSLLGGVPAGLGFGADNVRPLISTVIVPIYTSKRTEDGDLLQLALHWRKGLRLGGLRIAYYK